MERFYSTETRIAAQVVCSNIPLSDRINHIEKDIIRLQELGCSATNLKMIYKTLVDKRTYLDLSRNQTPSSPKSLEEIKEKIRNLDSNAECGMVDCSSQYLANCLDILGFGETDEIAWRNLYDRLWDEELI